MDKLGLGLILAGGAMGAYFLLRERVTADTGWTCPNCGFRADEEPEWCPACGTPPEPWMPTPVEPEEPPEEADWPTDQWPYICPQCGNVRVALIMIYPPPACPVCGYQGSVMRPMPPRVPFGPLRDPVVSKTDAAMVVAHYLGYDYTTVRSMVMCTAKWPDPECFEEWSAGGRWVGGTSLSMSIEEYQDEYAVTARRYSAGTMERHLVGTGLYLVKRGKVYSVTLST